MADEPLYYSLSNNASTNRELLRANANYVEDNHALRRGKASRTFLDYDANISVRGEFNRNDYELFREYERMPKTPHDTMRMCNAAYRKVGPIRNVIDLMGDFGCQGIRLQHPTPAIQRFYNRWFEYVNGKHISERFLNQLYRLGIVFMRRWMGFTSSEAETEMKRIHGNDGLSIQIPLTVPREIPLKYTSLNPMAMRIVGGEMAASFLGKPIYALNIPQSLKAELSKLAREPNSTEFDDLLADPDVQRILAGSTNEIILKQSEFEVFEYKKDDWEVWPTPMIDSILDDVVMLSKLKLADTAALDGVISSVRLWRLGHINESHPTHSILPTRVAIQKLRNILANTGNGPIDIVWGPELDFKESETKIYQVLGSAKYESTWDSIYDGLGVPPALRSAAAGGSGQTNAFISLKNLIERLEYGRNILTRFWMKEIRLVQKAMGFPSPAKVSYNQIIINDESAEKKLLIDLIDRNVISEEAVQERFGYIPDIESLRVKRQERKREKKKYPPKAGPFHNALQDHELRKIILQSGGVAPSEVGVELEERKKGEKSLVEIEAKYQKSTPQEKKLGKNPSAGRPKNVTETKKRKPRREQPRSRGFVDLFLWATTAQENIANFSLQPFLHVFGKKNVRSMTNEQFDQYENIKFAVLANTDPFSVVDEQHVHDLLAQGVGLDEEIVDISKDLIEQFVSIHERKPTVAELRSIQASAFALKFEVEDGEDSDDV